MSLVLPIIVTALILYGLTRLTDNMIEARQTSKVVIRDRQSYL